ncbi:MAG TPA: response regulator [Verrucomicrobiae bacterium]|nr:response regulator [Verrucomicrobiae bacterium]
MSALRPILIAEDGEDDAFLITKALEEIQVPNPIRLVRNGADAITYLEHLGKGPLSSEIPALLLLDLRMPAKDGFDVLAWLNQHPALKASLPAVVLSSSLVAAEVKAACDLGAREFVEKPLAYHKLKEALLSVKEKWLDT